MDLRAFEEKIFSQNGEDGVTQKLIHSIYPNPYNKYYVEFGVQDGKECNTRILREKYKWKGLMMDSENNDEAIDLRKEFITKENIISLFRKYQVPLQFNLLSVDIDYNDFYCLREILQHYQVDIIICEYNSTHSPFEDKIVVYDPNGSWDISNYFGASLLSITKLANSYGYSLVYCDKRGVNCFFIHDSIIKSNQLEILNINNVEKIYSSPKYGIGPDGGHAQD